MPKHKGEHKMPGGGHIMKNSEMKRHMGSKPKAKKK